MELYCVTRYSSQHTLEEQWNLCLIFGVLVDCNFLSFQSCFYRLLSACFQKLLVIFAETLYNQWGLVELATAISPWAPFSTECPRFCNPFRSAAVHRGCFVRHLEWEKFGSKLLICYHLPDEWTVVEDPWNHRQIKDTKTKRVFG